MSYGFRAINGNNIVTVDEDSWSYVYMGKWAIDVTSPYEQDISIHCVGYPLIFMGVPYNAWGQGESNSNMGHGFLSTRSGIQIIRVRDAGDGGTWVITVHARFINNSNPGPLYLRVFGKLHENFPNGAGQSYGARAWNAVGQLIFDTGCRQLRLAGNTYDAEMVLQARPPLDTDRVDAYDTVIGLPFDLANKSVMVNTRGTITYPYYVETIVPYDGAPSEDIYDTEKITTLFWGSGNALYARRASVQSGRMSNVGLVFQPSQLVYTRVAVIDNNLFP